MMPVAVPPLDAALVKVMFNGVVPLPRVIWKVDALRAGRTAAI